MKSEQEIVEILVKELNSVYCDNCSSNSLSEDDENCHCENCHRKSMYWGLSINTATRLAKKIIN